MIHSFAQRPERPAAAPGVEPDTGAAGERRGQRSLRYGDEAEAHPHAVEPLRPREDGGDAEGSRMVEGRRDELRGDLEGIVGTVVAAHDGSVQQDIAPVLLADERADEPLAARARRVRAPGERGRRRGPRHGGVGEELAGRRVDWPGPGTAAL